MTQAETGEGAAGERGKGEKKKTRYGRCVVQYCLTVELIRVQDHFLLVQGGGSR